MRARACVCIGLAGSNRNITTVMPSIRILLFLLEEKLGGTQHFVNSSNYSYLN